MYYQRIIIVYLSKKTSGRIKRNDLIFSKIKLFCIP